jgi:3-dehydrosphinganine reductase
MKAGDFSGANAYITGGSSGIGFAIAGEMIKLGSNVLLVARDEKKLAEAAVLLEKRKNKNGQRIDWLSLDIGDWQRVKSLLPEKVKSFGPPDILVNCAGIAHTHYFEKIGFQRFSEVINTNLSGTWGVSRALVQHLKERQGYIVNVASTLGFVGSFGYTAYAPAKFGIVGFSESLRPELKPYGVRISVLCPPDTDTPQLVEDRRNMLPEVEAINGAVGLMQPEQVAKALIKGMIRERFMIIPGFMNKLAYLLKRIVPWLPSLIMDGIIKSVQRKGE